MHASILFAFFHLASEGKLVTLLEWATGGGQGVSFDWVQRQSDSMDGVVRRIGSRRSVAKKTLICCIL